MKGRASDDDDRGGSSLYSRYAAALDAMARHWTAVKPYLPPVNFITVHHAYFIFGGLIVSVIFWALSNHDEVSRSVSFADSLFLVISSFTTSGLNTVNLSDLGTGQQAILCVMMILGSPVLVSLFTIWFRTHIFEKRFEDIVESEREKRRRRTTGTMVGMAGAMFGLPVMSSFGTNRKSHKQRAKEDAFELSKTRSNPRTSRGHGRSESNITQTVPNPALLKPIQEGQRLDNNSNNESSTSTSFLRPSTARRRAGSVDVQSTNKGNISDGFDFRTFLREHKKSVGRNGQFFDLSDEEREYLGGVEYRALKLLFVIIGVYFVALQILGAITLGAWLAVHSRSITDVNAQNPWWAGIFLAISSFHNAGLTLLDAGIAAFDNDGFVLTVVTLLSLAGNAAFPACIRGTVFLCRWLLKYVIDYVVDSEGARVDDLILWLEAFDFVLKYPRRLFMLMFPSKANLVFVAFFSTLVALDWVLILVLSIGNSLLDVYPVGKRIGIAFFQALAVPSPGFAIFSISGLWFDVQVLLLIIMYLSAYPEIIVMRNSNVYEERSLGIYSAEEAEAEEKKEEAGEASSLDELITSSRGGPLLSAPMLSSTRPKSISQATVGAFSTASTARSIKKLSAVGRRGTAFVGRQIQKRMHDFNGVGVHMPPPPPQLTLRRAPEIDFGETKPANVVAAQEGHVSLVSQHLRGQLSHDIWFIALALFLVTLIETSHSMEDPKTYSVFNFLFEVVSGYTNIGLSVGLPDAAYSFSGGWYTGSKIVMVLMMIRGRQRGLPVALDHSVKLPGWENARQEDEDAEIRRSFSKQRASLDM